MTGLRPSNYLNAKYILQFNNTPVEIGLFSTRVGGCGQKKSGFCQFTEKWLELELSCKNNIFDPLGKLFKSKRRRL